MKSSRKNGSRSFSARAKRDLRPHPPTAGSHGREASLPQKAGSRAGTKLPRKTAPKIDSKSAPKATPWFGPQPVGRRKVARPFIANRPFEARFSAARARGEWRLDRPTNRARIRRIVANEAVRSGVRIGKVAIAPTSLRFELAAPRRENLSHFFRAVAGRIPRAVTGSERGRPLASRGRKVSAGNRQFWDGLVATHSL